MNSTQEFAAGKNNISWVGSNFKEHLYGIDFDPAVSAVFNELVLAKPMNDVAIAAEFGPEAVTLGDVLAYLKEADRARWYIFYVNDAEGTRWAVLADWGGGGWGVGASPVSIRGGWLGGSVVVSRSFSGSKNQALNPSETLALPSELVINGITYKRV